MCWQTDGWDHRREVLLDYKGFNAAVTVRILFSLIQISQWTCTRVLIGRITAQRVSVPQQIISHGKSGTRCMMMSPTRSYLTWRNSRTSWNPNMGAHPAGLSAGCETHFFFALSFSLPARSVWQAEADVSGYWVMCRYTVSVPRNHNKPGNSLPTSVTFLLISFPYSSFFLNIWSGKHVYVRECAAGEHFKPISQ